MELQILLIVILTALICNGVHAVTRPKMLLWFLGVRLHTLDHANELRKILMDRIEELYNEKEQKQNDAFDKSGGNTENEDYTKSMAEIDGWYEEEIRGVNNRFSIDISWNEKRAAFLAKKPIIAFFLSIAPALTECLTCMASFWGTAIFALYFSGVLFCPLVFFPLFLFAVAGLNTIILNKTH